MQNFDWSGIDTVLLDMDGTLLDLHYDNHFWLQHTPMAYARQHGLSYDEAREQLVSRFGSQQGTLNWYCVDFWSEQLGMDIGALKHETRDRIREHPTTRDFLEAIRASGRESWLVTNAHHKSLNLKLDHTGIGHYFDRIVCSHDYRAPKESQDFWQQLQADFPFNPARSLLIDDSESVLRSAQRYGIGHLLTIARPDSQNPKRENLHFRALESFHDIMPIPHRNAAK